MTPESAATKEEEWVDCGEKCCCHKCGGATEFRIVTSSDGAYDDEHHRCKACGATKWTNGGDA